MTDRPTRFCVEWDATVNPDTDALDVRRVNVDGDREAARKIAEDISRKERRCVQVIERTNITDVTPKGDPRGLIWDWDEDWANVEDVWVEVQ